MTPCEALIERLTHRLRIDPELHMDITNELRAHLEDAAEAYRQGGCSNEEAEANAVKALGDEAELTELLWQANRRRVRFRQVAKWAARVTLLPAAVVVALAIALHVLTTVMLMGVLSGEVRGGWAWGWTEGPSLASLTEEQRFIFEGDPKLGASHAHRSVLQRLLGRPPRVEPNVDTEKSITDRWPDNPIYYGNYIGYYLNSRPHPEGKLALNTPGELNDVIAKLDHGERIEPDNAFYNFTKAGILIQASSELSDDAGHTYETKDRDGKSKTVKCFQIKITHPVGFERGMSEFLKGLPKPHFTSHSVDMARLRLDLLPPVGDLAEYLRREGFKVQILLPGLAESRNLTKSICAYALQLAETQKRDEATRFLRGAEIMAAKVGADAQTLIEILVAGAMRDMAMGHALCVYNEMTLPDQARQARAQLDADANWWPSLRAGKELRQQLVHHGGIIEAMMTPDIRGYESQIGLMNQAEYAVAYKAVLAGLLGVLVILTLGSALVTMVAILRCRGRDDGPKLLFVGWQRLGWICFWAIVVPVVAYAVYAYAAPWGIRIYGLNLAGWRILMEGIVLCSAMYVVLLSLSYAAIRKRAQEAGMVVPRAIRWRNRVGFIAVGGVLSVVAVVSAVWEFKVRHGSAKNIAIVDFTVGPAVAAAVVTLLWTLRELVRLVWLPKDMGHFRRTLFRSLVPILAVASLAVGIGCGYALTAVEASGLREAPVFFFNEVDASGPRDMKAQFIKQHQALLAEFCAKNVGAQTRPVD
jgi:hypothetical protein